MTHSFSRKDGLFFSAPSSPEFVVLLSFVFKWLNPFHPNQMFAVLFQIPLLDVFTLGVLDSFLSPRKMDWADFCYLILFLKIFYEEASFSFNLTLASIGTTEGFSPLTTLFVVFLWLDFLAVPFLVPFETMFTFYFRITSLNICQKGFGNL